MSNFKIGARVDDLDLADALLKREVDQPVILCADGKIRYDHEQEVGIWWRA